MLSLDHLTGTNFGYQRVPLERWLDDMVALGRSELELWGIAQHIDLFDLALSDVRRLQWLLRERGLHVSCVTPEQIMYPVNLASEDPGIIRYTDRLFRNAAELCAELGGSTVFLTAGWTWDGDCVDEARRRSARRIHDVADHAAALGLRCVMEALQWHESTLTVGSAALAEVLDAADAPTVGVALDTVAMATASEGIDDYFGRFGDRIWHVHLVDGSPGGHMVWGDGDLPLDDYLAGLRAHGYDGLLTAEIFGSDYLADPTAAHARNIEAVRAAFDRLDAAARDA